MHFLLMNEKKRLINTNTDLFLTFLNECTEESEHNVNTTILTTKKSFL